VRRRGCAAFGAPRPRPEQWRARRFSPRLVRAFRHVIYRVRGDGRDGHLLRGKSLNVSFCQFYSCRRISRMGTGERLPFCRLKAAFRSLPERRIYAAAKSPMRRPFRGY